MTRKYEKYFFDPPPVPIAGDNAQNLVDNIIKHNARPAPNLTLNYHFVTRPYISKILPHTHNYQEFLAWYGCNLKEPDGFDAEIVLYMGKELEKYIITKPTLVSLPPGFLHCPMVITKVGKPFFQIAMALEIKNVRRGQ
jgi:hypothetical protein